MRQVGQELRDLLPRCLSSHRHQLGLRPLQAHHQRRENLRSKYRVGREQHIEVGSLEGDYSHVAKTTGRETVLGVGFQAALVGGCLC